MGGASSVARCFQTMVDHTESSFSPTVDSRALTSIASMLEEHGASVSADFKTSFATLEARLDEINVSPLKE